MLYILISKRPSGDPRYIFHEAWFSDTKEAVYSKWQSGESPSEGQDYSPIGAIGALVMMNSNLAKDGVIIYNENADDQFKLPSFRGKFPKGI